MIKIKTPADIEEMSKAGALSKMALRRVGELIRPGISTLELDHAAEGLIRAHGAKPAFKGYEGFPASICSSINDQVVHGIPSPDVHLEDGDIVSIDTGAVLGGWVGDNAWTFFCGEPSREARTLCEIGRDCLKAGIAQALPGNHLGDSGCEVRRMAERNVFSVVRDFVGHGVGRDMHQEPNVPNFGKRGRGVKLQAGMVIAIEPMITAGTHKVSVERNGWTVVTRDGSLACHFENTVAITSDGPRILTTDAIGPWCELEGGVHGQAE